MTDILAPTAHAVLGASSSSRWIACPGSIKMSEGCANNSSEDADRGTAAHEVCALCLQNGQDAVEMIDRTFNKRFICDEAMTESVQLYLDAVRSRYEPEKGDLLFIEEPFSLKAIVDTRNWPNGKAPDMFGTSDAVIFKPSLQRLCVLDYKNGAGFVVDVIGNTQGRYYGLGAALKLQHLNVAEIEITIVQPNASHADGPVRSEIIGAFDLIEWTGDLLDYAEKTMAPDAALSAGKHCRFCPGKVKCPELRNQAVAVAKTEFADDLNLVRLPPAVESLSDEQLSKILQAGRLLTDWYRGAQAEAFGRLSQGGVIPNWKLVAKQARRKWAVEDENELLTSLALEADIPPDHMHVPKLKSPAQMGKGLNKDQKTAMAKYVVKKSSGATLAPDGDKRPAIAAGAALDFGDGLAGDDE